MKELMAELMKKKKEGKEMDPSEKKAKMGILGQIRDMAAQSMGDDVKGLKKVTVASSDPEGLKEGLDKAKEMIASKGDEEESEPAGGDGDDEDKIENEIESDDLSHEEIDELISALQAKKEKLSK
jgi:hypothetical protein